MPPTFWQGDRHVYLGAEPNWRFDESTDVAAPLAMGLPGQLAHFAFDADFADTGRMFAGTRALGDEDWESRVYRCGNGTCAESAELDGLQEPAKVAVPSDSDGDVTFAWAGTRFFRSETAGGAWRFVEQTLPTAGKVTGFADDGDGRYYLSLLREGGGGLLRSIDGGVSWSAIGASMALGDGIDSVVVLDDGTLVAAPGGSGLLCSTNGGSSWRARC